MSRYGGPDKLPPNYRGVHRASRLRLRILMAGALVLGLGLLTGGVVYRTIPVHAVWASGPDAIRVSLTPPEPSPEELTAASTPPTSATPSTSTPSGSVSRSGGRTSVSSASSAPRRTTSRAPSPDGTTSASTGSNAAANAVLAQINRARAEEGLSALTMSSGLVRSADKHSLRMARGCGLSHRCSGEAGLGDRISAEGVSWQAVGENVGYGGPVSSSTSAITSMARQLTSSMLAERPPDDGHRRNILSSSFGHVGISVYRDSSGVVWMTQDFSD